MEEKVKKKMAEKVQIVKMGVRRKMVIGMWAVLLGSIFLGIYNNYTAVDTHTIKEIKQIEEKLVDTNRIENYVKQFAKEYYSWENKQGALEQRVEKVNAFLTKELQDLNIDIIRSDIPTSSTVKEIAIWEVKKVKKEKFEVVFSVDQDIREGETITTCNSFYMVTVHLDQEGNLVIIKNPTICDSPKKSDFVPENVESDGTVDANTMDEVNEFLYTFFKLYPSASENVLSYYVKDNALKPIEKEGYLLDEIINPVYVKRDGQVNVSFAVSYLDQQTKAVQISQFDLKLEKSDNWMIIK